MSVQDPENKTETADSKSGAEDPKEHQRGGESPGDRPKEIGGRDGLDPTRYGDWEKAGRCIDF